MWKNVFADAESHRCAATGGGRRYFTDVAGKSTTTTTREGVTDRQLQLWVAIWARRRHSLRQQKVQIAIS